MIEVLDVPQIRQCFDVESKLKKLIEKLSGKLACENDINVLSDETCDEKKTTAIWKDENADIHLSVETTPTPV